MAIARPTSDLLVGGWSGVNAPSLLASRKVVTTSPEEHRELDWSNPLNNGAVAVLHANCLVDLKSRSSAYTTFIYNKVPTAHGTAIRMADHTTQGFYSTAPDTPHTGKGATYFWVGTTGSSTSSTSSVVGDGSFGFITFSGLGFLVALGPVVGAVDLLIGYLPTNTFCVLVLTATSSGDWRVYLNGKMRASGSAPTMENNTCSGLSLGNFGIYDNYSSPADHQMAGKYVGNVWTSNQVKSFSANPWQIFQPKQVVSYINNPSSDLYSTLDEEVVDDADYIATNITGSIARLALTPLADPGNDNNHVLRYRASSPEGDLGVNARVVQYGNQGIITSKRPWRNQPLSLVEVDWANPLTKNMVFAYLPGLRKDLTGRAGIGEVRGTGTIASPTGLYTTGTINDSGLRIHDTLPLLGGRHQSTVIAVAETSAGLVNAPGTEGDGLISNNGNALYCERGATGKAIYKIGALYWPTGPALRSEFTYRSDANVLIQVSQPDATINNGKYHFFAGVRNGGTVSSRVNNLTTSSAYGGGTDFSNVQRRINSDAGDVASIWNGATSLCAGWHRSLSTGELDELYKNPWQIFKPKKQIGYFGSPDTIIATRTPTLTTVPTNYVINMTNAEASLITDYTKLSVEFESL